MDCNRKDVQAIMNSKQGGLISIVTVVFNASSSLESTILSVVNQSYKNIEYIIIDGGSDDNTIEIIERYADKIAYWISEPDQGIYDAMNKAVSRLNGDWVYFVNAGDIMINVLDKLVPMFVDINCIYYGDVYRNDLLKVYDGKFSGFKLAVNNICHQSIFYSQSVFKKYRYNIKYRSLADHDLNMRCYGDKDLNFKYLPVLVCLYEGNGFSVQNSIDTHFFKDKMGIIKANFSYTVYCYAFLRRKIANFAKKFRGNRNIPI